MIRARRRLPTGRPARLAGVAACGARIAAAAALLSYLPGCLSAPIAQARDAGADVVRVAVADAREAARAVVAETAAATEARIAQAGAEARQTAEDAIRAADAATAARVEQIAAEARAARAEALADVSARLTAQREAAAADVARLLAPVRDEVAAVRAESAEWRGIAARALDESAGWRAEVAAWRGEAASLRAAFTGGPQGVAESARPGDPAPAPGGLPAEERYALWAALAGAVFTAGKTAVRLWRARSAAAPNCEV